MEYQVYRSRNGFNLNRLLVKQVEEGARIAVYNQFGDGPYVTLEHDQVQELIEQLQQLKPWYESMEPGYYPFQSRHGSNIALVFGEYDFSERVYALPGDGRHHRLRETEPEQWGERIEVPDVK